MRVERRTVGDEVAQQAAAFPVRRTRGALEVCLIRRKDSATWGIPKGNIDPGDTAEETALNEALEEAGLEGRLLGKPVGTYRYEKWGSDLLVLVYVMHVIEEHDDWEEDRIREREWVSLDEAGALLLDHPVWPLLETVTEVAARKL